MNSATASSPCMFYFGMPEGDTSNSFRRAWACPAFTTRQGTGKNAQTVSQTHSERSIRGLLDDVSFLPRREPVPHTKCGHLARRCQHGHGRRGALDPR